MDSMNAWRIIGLLVAATMIVFSIVFRVAGVIEPIWSKRAMQFAMWTFLALSFFVEADYIGTGLFVILGVHFGIANWFEKDEPLQSNETSNSNNKGRLIVSAMWFLITIECVTIFVIMPS